MVHGEEWRKIVKKFFYDKFFVSLKTALYDLKETVLFLDLVREI